LLTYFNFHDAFLSTNQRPITLPVSCGTLSKKRYETAQNKLEELRREHVLRQSKADAIGAFMFAVSEQNALKDFDAKLWTTIIRSATVYSDGRMVFHFMTGADIVV